MRFKTILGTQESTRKCAEEDKLRREVQDVFNAKYRKDLFQWSTVIIIQLGTRPITLIR